MTKYSVKSICPHCGHEERVYRVYFNPMLLSLITRIFKLCILSKSHEFVRYQIQMTHSEYVNMALLQRFGLIYFVNDKKGARWGVPVKRVARFLSDKWSVAKYSERVVGEKHSKSSKEKIKASEVDGARFLLGKSTMKPYFIQYIRLDRSGTFGSK